MNKTSYGKELLGQLYCSPSPSYSKVETGWSQNRPISGSDIIRRSKVFHCRTCYSSQCVPLRFIRMNFATQFGNVPPKQTNEKRTDLFNIGRWIFPIILLLTMVEPLVFYLSQCLTTLLSTEDQPSGKGWRGCTLTNSPKMNLNAREVKTLQTYLFMKSNSLKYLSTLNVN